MKITCMQICIYEVNHFVFQVYLYTLSSYIVLVVSTLIGVLQSDIYIQIYFVHCCISLHELHLIRMGKEV